MDIERKLFLALDDIGLFWSRREGVLNLMDKLKNFDKYKWEHSIRVGLGCKYLAEKYFSNWPTDKIFVAGLLHDVGILDIDSKVVGKANIENPKFTKEDYEQIKKHVVCGYRMVSDRFYDEARIFLYHHMVSRGYPENLPDRNDRMRIRDVDARKYGRLVELVDFADSLKRKNGKFGKLDLVGRKKILIDNFDEFRNIIEDSYREGVFS